MRRGDCPAGDADRVVTHLKAAGLPSHPRDAGLTEGADRLVAHMMQDKKMSGGKLPFILARGIGQSWLAKDVDIADVTAFMADVLAE